MRMLFYQLPNDSNCWEIEDEYMYGDKYLIAPVLNAGQKIREVYLPDGWKWKEMESGAIYTGGQMVNVDCPIEIMPVFIKL